MRLFYVPTKATASLDTQMIGWMTNAYAYILAMMCGDKGTCDLVNDVKTCTCDPGYFVKEDGICHGKKQFDLYFPEFYLHKLGLYKNTIIKYKKFNKINTILL